MILENIYSSEDIKKLNIDELKILSGEIREFLINSVSETGGHLASNLGVVELTLAIHKVFDFSKDKIIFDVGHQSYVHKIITGRKDKFETLRKHKGIAGFPKIKESEYDFFNSGHSSNSLSVALGMKRASQIMGIDNNVIAFIGDGSFGGGMIYEAINDIGNDKEKDNIIIILNDNEMSISKNDSSISKYLSKLRINNSYIDAKEKVEHSLDKVPLLKNVISSAKKTLRKAIATNGEFFENLGIKYYGPYDGHNLEELVKILKVAKNLNKPVLIHTVTKKGKGYEHAENNPEKFHGISAFDILTGNPKNKKKDYSSVFGSQLVKLAKDNKNVVAITAAMPSGTGLLEFKNTYPDRFFDVGICEEHAVSMCAGMALSGIVPVFCVYSSFLQRAYDQLVCDVCAMNLHVVFGVDRAGIVGEDGETHQGVFDISYLTSIPNMTVLSPADFNELEMMLSYAVNVHNGPIAIRYPRGSEISVIPSCPPLEYKKSSILHKGDDITIVCEGRMVSVALKLASHLIMDGIKADVINARFIKPVDTETIKQSVLNTKRLLVIEEGVAKGGLGEAIYSSLSDISFSYLSKSVGDKFVEHGSFNELLCELKLDEDSIYKEVKEVFGL